MSGTPLEQSLPRFVDPRKFAQQGASLQGRVAISEMKRLCGFLSETSGTVHAVLAFTVEEQGFRCLTGTLNADVTMLCQRCLQASSQQLQTTLKLSMVWNDTQAFQLPKVFDPWVVGEGQADLYQIIEDELIISLPMVAYHDYSCIDSSLLNSERLSSEAGEVSQQSQLQQRNANPFQVLEQFKGSLATDTIEVDSTQSDN